MCPPEPTSNIHSSFCQLCLLESILLLRVNRGNQSSEVVDRQLRKAADFGHYFLEVHQPILNFHIVFLFTLWLSGEETDPTAVAWRDMQRFTMTENDEAVKDLVTSQGVADLVFQKCHTIVIYYSLAKSKVSQDFAGLNTRSQLFPQINKNKKDLGDKCYTVKQTGDGMINYSALAVCWDNGFSALMNLTKEKPVGSY